ncbi:MAG: HAMP domain-containing histidine kinase [Marinilabiliaceae bacterium]|nr:HAMP domain-containing histidine kinase [Marinilabiliaceae bacterium]
MGLRSLFKRKKEAVETKHTYTTAEMLDFVSDNIACLKKLLSAQGSNNRARRLIDLADITRSQVVLLCAKGQKDGEYWLVESSDPSYGEQGTKFTWQHTQAMASNDAMQIFSAMPFPKIGISAYISVPIKNKYNVVTGLLMALSVARYERVDEVTQLMHLLAPIFEAEISLENYKEMQKQCESRILALNQNAEALQTDLKREKEKSAENREFKSIFLTNLSQEVRTPMNVIVGFSDLLESAESPEQRHEFIDAIKQNSNILLKLIDNMVEISKLQISYMFKPAVPRQLNELLTSIKIKYEEQLKEENKPIQIETSFALSTPNDTIWNSEEIILKVMGLIIDKACKQTSYGLISLGYSVENTKITFFVRDTGEGMNLNNAERVFDLFSSQDTNSNDDDSINLALAKKYVTLVDGDIWVDTKYRNGTAIYFTIPMQKL